MRSSLFVASLLFSRFKSLSAAPSPPSAPPAAPLASLRGLSFTSLISPVSIFCDPSLALSRHRGSEKGDLSLPDAESPGGPVRPKVLQGEPSPSGCQEPPLGSHQPALRDSLMSRGEVTGSFFPSVFQPFIFQVLACHLIVLPIYWGPRRLVWKVLICIRRENK